MRTRRNTKSNNLIRDIVIALDFVMLVALLYVYMRFLGGTEYANGNSFFHMATISCMALVVAQYLFSTVIHRRQYSAEKVLRQVTLLVLTQVLVWFLLTKGIYWLSPTRTSPKIMFTFQFAPIYLLSMVLMRFLERWVLKRYRRLGGNTRTALLVGSDEALKGVYDFLTDDPATGYRLLGYYANHDIKDAPDKLAHLGTLADFDQFIETATDQKHPDELYCSLSWSKRDEIHRIMKFCDRNVIHFYFVPVFAESFGHSLKVEQIGETVGFTNYIDPLSMPTNKFIKRTFDILFSAVVLTLLLPLFPIIALIIKLQSPGPIFFKQLRTGMNGENFMCYKFRSMHVNKDADRLQATKDDPRKFAFGNFMRKANIDELPQFWNVLKGDMSVVGPRPHMLAHTEQYSQLIDKYMVRHFVKPGVTGWAQVTGFRGETKELWQMEGRVKRDIWYIENWSVWLDIRIIWRTFKSVFVHDENAF